MFFNHRECKSVFLVCLIEQLGSLDESLTSTKTGISNVYLFNFNENPSDLDLPDDSVCIFRIYPWPFTNNLQYSHFDMCAKTFKGKGLIRNCTIHQGNFEIFGTRWSKQSNGNMLCLACNVDNHQYYREFSNISLVPIVKSIINF